MLTAPWIRGSGSPAWMIFVSKRCEGFAILMPSVLLMPHFLVFCEGFSLRPLPSLQHTRERGIHRRDAENFECLSCSVNNRTKNVKPNINAPEVEVGCKEGGV